MSLFSLLFAACSGQETESVNQDVVYFIPPTLADKAEQIVLITPTPLPPTPEPDCENNLIYVEDVTVEDGTVFLVGDKIEKIWKVQNTGTCDWEAGYTIQLVNGSAMGAAEFQALIPARAGSEVDIRIVFTAPDNPDRYQSWWQAIDPNGAPFGEVFFMDVIIESAPEEAPTATPSE